MTSPLNCHWHLAKTSAMLLAMAGSKLISSDDHDRRIDRQAIQTGEMNGD